MRLSRREIPEQNAVRVAVNQSGAGTLVLAAAQLGKRHRLVGAILTMPANGTIKFAGSTSGDLTGPFDVAQYGGFVYDSDVPFIQAGLNEDLQLITTGGGAHGIALVVPE
jgi:hypothetical protein